MDITAFLQSKGYSRRTIVQLLQDGLVKKNDAAVDYRKEPVVAGDTVTIDTVPPTAFTVEGEITEYDIVLFNKPQGYIVSKADEHNETIFSLFPAGWDKKYNYIGRLDKDSHGLLVLTNATKLVSFYSHPRYQHKKVYKVLIDRSITAVDIKDGKAGMRYYDKDTKESMILSWEGCKQIGENTYEVTIHEGKKRHIRRLFETLGYMVLDLSRIQFGPWELGDIPEGKWEIQTISSSDVENLLESQSSYKPKQI